MSIRWTLLPLLCLFATSCQLYNQNILFKTKESIILNQTIIEGQLSKAEQNYLIQKKRPIGSTSFYQCW